MPTTESRPSFPGRPSWSPSRTSWIGDESPSADRASREASPPPPSTAPTHAKQPSSVPSPVTVELVESLESIVEHAQSLTDRDRGEGDGLFRSVRKLARAMQQKIAKLGGMKPPQRGGDTARPSISSTLDGYRPEVDVVAPISVRPNAMELLWVCGDCGAHYPRQQQCPEKCTECGAPKQNFYAPIED